MQSFGRQNSRITWVVPRSPTKSTAGSCSRKPRLRAFNDQSTLELSQGRKDSEDQLSAGSRGVNHAIAQRTKPDASVIQLFNGRNQMLHRPPKAIQPPDDQSVTFRDSVKSLLQAPADQTSLPTLCQQIQAVRRNPHHATNRAASQAPAQRSTREHNQSTFRLVCQLLPAKSRLPAESSRR